jgi:pimeloyl-ACP methyl ester carboxylesterase
MQTINKRPTHSTFFVDLPLCRLNVMRAGQGEAMIMLPATISRLENWHDLVDFTAQWFEVYFFELPGHGESSPFQQPFSTTLIGPLVEQLVDQMGIHRFSLMGFSFGGILAMQVFSRLQRRIDNLVLLSPCLTWRAIQVSAMRRELLLTMMALLKHASVRNKLYHFLHDPTYLPYSASFLRRIGNIEATIPVADVLKKIQPTTLEILTAQIFESLKFDYPPPQNQYTTPCYLAMSVFDPLIDFNITVATLQRFFAKPEIIQLDYPFHQPPKPFTFDELNRGFGATVEAFLAERWEAGRYGNP